VTFTTADEYANGTPPDETVAGYPYPSPVVAVAVGALAVREVVFRV
jgi:hypothetical protein